MSFDGERFFEDVDNDGRMEMRYRRHYSYGNFIHTYCDDPGWIIWEFDGSELWPDRLLLEDGTSRPPECVNKNETNLLSNQAAFWA